MHHLRLVSLAELDGQVHRPLPCVVNEVDAPVEVDAVDRQVSGGVIDHPAVGEVRLGRDDLGEETAEVGGRQAGAEFAVAELVALFHIHKVAERAGWGWG